MNVSTDQLAALVAVVDEGSFDGAATVLHLTPSAVSQRIRALEEALGQVVVRRSRPVQPTDPGRAVLRTARQVLHLQHDLAANLGTAVNPGGTADAGESAGLGAPRRRATVSVAVNSDSLATWFMPALEALQRWGDVAVELHREDELRSADLLRDGRVMAAVAATPVRLQGCSVTPLGALRYVPVAAPHVVDRWFAGGVTPARLRAAPVVDFDRDDSLQRRFVALVGGGEPAQGAETQVDRAADARPGGGADAQLDRETGEQPAGVLVDAGPRSFVPSSREYADAIRLGLGWGLVPTDRVGGVAVTEGTGEEGSRGRGRGLTVLDTDPGHLDVPLFWLRWSLDTPVLAALTDAVHRAAATRLLPLP
ncbi:ArgP/LysG family DNA-binding transcriptional regulator [Tersicoccus sp. Bi-70]|uniref:ArgP/LysG family DNA-binding transcriptional regulator n=1 Tax=Tersicoccus sp. Bi-70 TaxID=1897634 RepID=UPI0009769B87|nr:ArgP/LysG family DNA-binding transcriptional regulator [Tersicoccus sp. Bi-70]OMH36724.1 hypothetical protein BGP79_13070 [Tersicoccus sp. Bi-70]